MSTPGNSVSNSQDSFRDSPNLSETRGCVLRRCLLLNRQYQMKIKQFLDRLNGLIEEVMEEQAKIMGEGGDGMNNKGYVFKQNRKPINLFASPYFRSENGMYAPENSDAIIKRVRNDVSAYTQPPRPWSITENNNLANAVYENALKTALKPLVNRELFLREKLQRNKYSEEEEAAINQTIDDLRTEMRVLKRKSKLKHIEDMKDEPDWLNISAVNMKGGRSPEECEGMWKTFLHPHINRRKFQHDEDRKLAKLAVARGFRNWDAIAEELGTGRTPIQCLERYQSQLNPKMHKGFWTPEDDERLKSVIEMCQVGDYIPWHQVKYFMEGFTRTQIFSRWHRHVKPESRVDKWTTEEDAVLFAAFEKYGKDWKKIANYFPGRTNYACRERIICQFLPTKGSGCWTVEDDRKLLKCYVEHGDGKWPKVAAKMINRTSKSCSLRLRTMKRRNPNKFAKAVKCCKAGVPGRDYMPESLLSTKGFPAYCSKRNRIKKQVLGMLTDALVKINGAKPENIDLYLKTIPVVTLKQLSAELLANQNYEARLKDLRYRPLHVYLQKEEIKQEKKKVKYRLSSTSSSSEEEVEEAVVVVEKKSVSPDEEDELNDALDEVFMPRIIAGNAPIRKSFTAKSRRDVVEYETLKYIIFKAFGFTDYPKPQTMFNTADYETSVTNLLQLFIFAVEDDYLPVLPPSISTLSGQLMIYATRALLECIAQEEKTQESIKNFRLIASDKPNISRKCNVCRNAMEVDEQQQQNVEDCKCAALKSMRKQFMLMRERFLSVFMWPALLSACPLNQEQIKKMIHYSDDTNTVTVKDGGYESNNDMVDDNDVVVEGGGDKRKYRARKRKPGRKPKKLSDNERCSKLIKVEIIH